MKLKSEQFKLLCEAKKRVDNATKKIRILLCTDLSDDNLDEIVIELKEVTEIVKEVLKEVKEKKQKDEASKYLKKNICPECKIKLIKNECSKCKRAFCSTCKGIKIICPSTGKVALPIKGVIFCHC